MLPLARVNVQLSGQELVLVLLVMEIVQFFCEGTDVPSEEETLEDSTDGGNEVLLNSKIRFQASKRTHSSGGGAPRDPVANSTDLR
mmetsp:Transcript_9022/g.20207  ORF Transcript_9022/g.20207 Transcript_9022/m.20207 type:complete len:86 (+) Transcript_9022:1784-2041(+)